ncbi:MAG: hypothetical protein KAV87_12340 [Desulfobacteraceae bacterium]|nr:hypothetical protein [Desulfobacteraceae bacterium]
MKIELNSKERQVLLDALIHDGYVDKIRQPQTPFFIRQLYSNLKTKISRQEVESMEAKPEQAIKLLRREINFINFKAPKMNEKEKVEAEKLILDYDKAITYLEDL